MRPRAVRLMLWPAAALLVMVIAGCAPGHPASSPLGPGPAANPADLLLAQAAILRLADMGAGYHQSAFTPTTQVKQDNAALDRCVGRPSLPASQTAQVFSQQLSRGQALEVLASITFVDTRKDARADLAAFSGPRAPACLQKSFLTQYERTGAKASAVVRPLSPSPTSGLPSADYRLTVLAHTTGGNVPVFLDIVRVIQGRAEVLATFQGVNQVVPASVEKRAISAMLDRL